MQPSPVLTRLLLGNIFLFALLYPLICHAESSGSDSPLGGRNYLIEAGKSKSVSITLGNTCRSAVVMSVKFVGKFIRSEQLLDSILVPPRGKTIEIKYDAKGLKPGEKLIGRVIIKCSKCKSQRCVLVPTEWPVEITVTEPTPRREDSSEQASDAKQILATLKNDLRLVSDEFTSSVQGLLSVRDDPRGEEQAMEFVVGKVSVAAKKAERQILYALRHKELQPLKDYVEEYYLVPTSRETHSAEIRHAPSPSVPPSFSPPRQPKAYSVQVSLDERANDSVESAAKGIFLTVIGFIAWVERNSGQVVLTLNSDPEGANIELKTKNGDYINSTSTNSILRGIWRGTYRIRVTKDGFRTIEQEHPLGFPDTFIECTLVTSGTPRYCRFK
jgi:hypothetical protein